MKNKEYALIGSQLGTSAVDSTTALGQEIAAILDEDLPAGNYSINFDGTLLSSGVYFYRFTSGNYVSVKKMAIVK